MSGARPTKNSEINQSNEATYMNHRIPRKSKHGGAPTSLGNRWLPKPTTKIVNTQLGGGEKSAGARPAHDIISQPIPRKKKVGAPQPAKATGVISIATETPNNKRKAGSAPTIVTDTKTLKKMKHTASKDTMSGVDMLAERNNNDSPLLMTRNDKRQRHEMEPVVDVPMYETIKEGRIVGYPVMVTQGGTEHDAILLGCKDNPQEYLTKHKNGKVKIRWKFAGYNGNVLTDTVRLIAARMAPPTRKAAEKSGLLLGDGMNGLKDDELGGDEDEDAPILKANRLDMLEQSNVDRKDADYNDQEDKDEKLICYERSASVGYQGSKSGVSLSATNTIAENCNEINAPSTADDCYMENATLNNNTATLFVPESPLDATSNNTDDIDKDSGIEKTAAANPSPLAAVPNHMGIKDEGIVTPNNVTSGDDPAFGYDTDDDGPPKPVVVTSDSTHIKIEGSDTDDEVVDLKPNKVTSGMNVKLEKFDTDDEYASNLNPLESVSNGCIKLDGTETDDEMDLKPSEVTSATMDVKTEEAETDDECLHLKKEDTILALKFFEKLNTLIENKDYDIDDTIMEMIKANPFLLTTKCPCEIGEIQEGCNIMEAISSLELGPDTRDFLYNVVLLGGKATDGCYENILNQSEFPINDENLKKKNEHLAVLILSGYFPTKGPSFVLDQLTDAHPRSRRKRSRTRSPFFLDQLTDTWAMARNNRSKGIQKHRRSRRLYLSILHILYKLIKPSDNLDVDSTIIDNINNLPSLKVGVTHSQGGSMDTLMKRYPPEKLNLKQLAVTEMMLFKLLGAGCKRKNDECIAQEGDRKKMQKANAEQLSDKEEEKECVCLMCKGSKRITAFSKNQIRKGDKRKCKVCIALAQKAVNTKQTNNSEEKLFQEPPSPEDCSICFLPLPIHSNQTVFHSCCGKKICVGCIYAMVESEGDNSLCPFCRTPHPKLIEEEVKRTKKLMEEGNAHAFYMLAEFYADGSNGLQQDRMKANELYLIAGKLGCSEAYYNLGNAYSNGRGVEMEKKKAKHYFELAAMNGYISARHNLGVLEAQTGNLHRATKHFILAAKAGCKESLDMVKDRYMGGIVGKDEYAQTLHSSGTPPSDGEKKKKKKRSQKIGKCVRGKGGKMNTQTLYRHSKRVKMR